MPSVALVAVLLLPNRVLRTTVDIAATTPPATDGSDPTMGELARVATSTRPDESARETVPVR